MRVTCLGQRVRQELRELPGSGIIENQPGADASAQRDQHGQTEQIQQPVVAAKNNGQDGAGIQLGAGQEAQLGKDLGLHFLGFIDQQYGPPESGGHERFPPEAQVFEAGPVIVDLHGNAEDIAHFAIEVRPAALGTAQCADDDIGQGLQVSREQPQGDRLAGAGFSTDEGEASVAHLLFDAPAKVLDLGTSP